MLEVMPFYGCLSRIDLRESIMVCGIEKAISPQIEDICGKIFCPSLKVFISQAIIPAVLLMSSRLLLFGAKLKKRRYSVTSTVGLRGGDKRG